MMSIRCIGQVREIAQGLVFDLAAFAVTTPQQVSAIDLVLIFARRSDDVSGSGSRSHNANYNQKSPNVKLFSDYIIAAKTTRLN